MSDETTGFTPTPSKHVMPAWYGDLLASVSDRVSAGRRRAVAAVNREVILTSWAIGRDILDRQNEQGYGTKVIDRLSANLRQRFPGVTGYSPRNLKYMRAFAAAWPDPEVVQGTLAQLPWWSQIALLEKLDVPDQRLWYADEAVRNGWGRDMLALQIQGRLHERSGKAITNFAATLPPEGSDMAQQATKDPYLFDFLGVADTRRDRDVERGLIDHVGDFLVELGQGFAYVGKQVRLQLNGKEFFCDLLFYHLTLRRFVVIELKAVPFDPGFLGQLGMYMAAVDDLLAHPGDGQTIGLLLCRSKDNVVAEYALRSMAAPIGVADWTDAITTSLPDELTSTLPTIAELEAELAEVPADDPAGDTASGASVPGAAVPGDTVTATNETRGPWAP